MNHMDLIDKYSAHNYHPLPVVLADSSYCWVWDVDGNKYLDMLAGYSAINFGHRNPEILNAAKDQLGHLTLTSRAFNNDKFGPFCEALAGLCGKDKVLPMNTGAEAVETAIKLARRWGYKKKGVPEYMAEIIVCDNNFHGRTTTIISFSTDQGAREGFGPYTPGFRIVPYGDINSLEAAISDRTVAFLVEPIQGEAGVIIPTAGYLKAVQKVCAEKNILFIADEIQSGLGRTGKTFACDLDGVKPDVYILGKALGGGILPLSAVVADDHIMDVFTPGSHGSTFGGNPLACAVGLKVIEILNKGYYQENAVLMGERMRKGLEAMNSPVISDIRSVGLWFGIDIDTNYNARHYGEALMKEGLLTKETHDKTLRLSPPLCIDGLTIDWALGIMERILV